jgi:hypothetical protein
VLDFLSRVRFIGKFLVAEDFPGSFAALSGSIFLACMCTVGGRGGGWLRKAACLCSSSSRWYDCKVRSVYSKKKSLITTNNGCFEFLNEQIMICKKEKGKNHKKTLLCFPFHLSEAKS